MRDAGTTVALNPAVEPAHARAERKAEHVRIALELGDARTDAGWEDVHLLHDALPDTDLDDVTLETAFLGRPVGLPLVIAGMTGGYPDAEAINRTLARAAQRHRAVIGVGSQRAALTHPEYVRTYAVVRDEAPNAVVVANIGINQLIDQDDVAGVGLDGAMAAIKMVGADALAIHLNFLEEVVQPEGQTRARGAAAALSALVEASPVPIIAKETGCGISRRVAERLRSLGVQAVDVGGWGGTSFAAIEASRARARGDTRRANIGDTFARWGIPTPASVAACASVLPTIATGGLRSGLDAAKALSLGASMVGIGRPLLEQAIHGEAALSEWIESFADQLRTATFLSGVATAADLPHAQHVVTGPTRDWIEASREGAL